MNRASALAVLGVLAFALGVATLAVPGLVVVGAERVVVMVIGALAILQLLRVVQIRRHGVIRRAGTADPELPTVVDQPGADIGAVLDQFDPDRYQYAQGNRRKSQIETVAVDALVRHRDCTESEARERIEQGTWTDDQVAAAFLGGDDAPSIPLGYRVRARLSGESTYRRGLRQTVAAIGAVAGHPAGSEGGDDDGSAMDLASVRRRFRGAVETGQTPSEWDEHQDSQRRLTGHWRGISGVALAGIGVGVLAEQATVILVGVVGISYAAYARSTTEPDPDISVERSVSPERPDPDETVEVTVTVTNEADRAIPDLRLVDGVPPALSVVDGSPRLGTALRAGETTRFGYTLDARRGAHEFEPVHVVTRNVAGTSEFERTVRTEEPTRITCVPPLRAVEAPVPLRNRPTRLTGRVGTNVGGEGTEFFATRTYRPGDPMNRIDWTRQAKTGELATLEFREERAVTAVLVVDATDSAAVGPDPRGRDAVDRSVDAATQAFTRLLDDGNRVGITSLANGDVWIPPGTGEDHRTRVRDCLATDPAFTPDERGLRSVRYRWLPRLRSRLPGDAQVVLFSPLCSPLVARMAIRIESYGYPVTVISPDPTVHRSAGTHLAAIVRRFRIADLRAAGVPVIEWDWDDAFEVALARSMRGWSP